MNSPVYISEMRISIGNSMISSGIWHKYHEWYFNFVICKFETILKYHEWYLCQISRTNHAIICLYYYQQTFVIFTCRHFKLSWNSTALSQSNCRNFSCTGISNNLMQIIILLLFLLRMELLGTPQLFAYESVLLFSESFLQPVENEKRKYIIL